MATFTQRQPASIATAVASRLSGHPNLSLEDIMKIDAAAANANYRDTMTESERQKMQIAREQENFRNNPANAQQMAAWAAGTPQAVGDRHYRHQMGQPEVMDPGVAGPPAPVQTAPSSTPTKAWWDEPDLARRAQGEGPTIPPEMTQAQRGSYDSSIAAAFANRIATGNTNAQQLMAAQHAANQNRRQVEIQDNPNPISRQVQMQAFNPAHNLYNTNAQGVTTGPTGLTEITNPALNTSITRQHNTAADANAALAQRRGIPPAGAQPRPPAPPRQQTPEQADKTKAETEKLRLANEAEKRKQLAQSQSQARSNFMREPAEIRKKYKGLGSRWIEGKGYEVIGLDGKPVPGLYYNEKGSGQ